MGFARRMKRAWEKEPGDVLERAAAFDSAATEMEEWEEARCRKDGSELEIVRMFGASMWEGTQYQYQCPACGGKYVQFVPDAEEPSC